MIVERRLGGIFCAIAAIVLAVRVQSHAAEPLADAFYQPPSPLPQRADGSVLRVQLFRDGAALPSAARNYRLLYETTAAGNSFVAVSGTLAIPKGLPPAAGWPLISWAHGTTGNAPQCAPSRGTSPNIEQQMLDDFVRSGYAVAQTDYEGIATPGIHPYLVPLAAARDVTDIVRASREIDSQIDRRWIAMGHSQGGTAVLATAALAPQLAPDLDLIGAVAYAPFSTPDALLRDELTGSTPNEGLIILALMVEGFSTVDPAVVPAKIFEPDVLRIVPELEQRCLPDLAKDSDWANLEPRTVFSPAGESSIEALYGDLVASNPRNFSISIPTLLVNGVADALVPSESTLFLRDRLRSHGTPVSFKAYVGATHGSVLEASLPDVAAWIAQRFIESREAANGHGQR